MARLIKEVPNRFKVEFDNGKFDHWCVYLTTPTKYRYAPRDTEYFSFFKELAKDYGSQKVYNDFIKVYEATTKVIETKVIEVIEELSSYYKDQSEQFYYWMVVVYAGMIAEENKAFTKLGKRVKRLGIYQILFEEIEVNQAANFSRGKAWRWISEQCTQRGF